MRWVVGGQAVNGHFGCTCYHQLFVFNQFGAKLITHARYSIFQMAEVAVPRDMFRRILELIDDLRSRPSVPC